MSVFLRSALLLLLLPLLAGSATAQDYFKSCAFNTGRSANLIIPMSAEPKINGKAMSKGTEIAVFSADGVCAGVVTWKEKNVAMTIWGDDILTSQKDGIGPDEQLHFYLWDASQNKLFAGPDLVNIDLDTSKPYYHAEHTYREGAIIRLTSLSVDIRHAAALTAPRNGTEVQSKEVALAWASAPGTYEYRLQVSPSITFSETLFDDVVDGTTATIEIDSAGDYFWRVGVAMDDATVWSETYSFSASELLMMENELVNGFLLAQNYPNPFNPSTTIPFYLEQGDNVTLRVYNMLGQEVATLVDGYTTAGAHEVRWDANDLPSGMYLYRLQRGRHVQSKTLTLIK
jgi:hypothetical protein